MKFCSLHWTQLRAAIDARGLTPFVAQGGEEAARRLAEGGEGRSSFDPLLGAHNAILSNALSTAGLDLMQAGHDGGEICPLCYLLAECRCEHRGTPQCPFASWVDHAADGALAHAKQLGLVGAS